MTKLTISTGLFGLLVGLAVSAYAHSGSGFETGPLVLLGLALSGIGVVGSVLVIFVARRRSPLVSGIGIFCAAMLIALISLPMLWPYPQPLGPVPLSGEPLR